MMDWMTAEPESPTHHCGRIRGNEPSDYRGPPFILASWEAMILRRIQGTDSPDPAHDTSHLRRVWFNAQRIMSGEPPCNRLVVLAASLLHDIVALPKDHPNRSISSVMAGARAARILSDMSFPAYLVPDVVHAIEAHSYSAGILPLTAEARIVQDADRIDALGAIGVARVFAVSGSLGRALAHPDDPMACHRPKDDLAWAVDHFHSKILDLPTTMKTGTGRLIAEERADYVRSFVDRFAAEWLGNT